MTDLFLIGIAGKQTFKSFASKANAEAYVAAAKRNSPRYPEGHIRNHFSCSEVDVNDPNGCTGLVGDPRCQGGHCYCRY